MLQATQKNWIHFKTFLFRSVGWSICLAVAGTDWQMCRFKPMHHVVPWMGSKCLNVNHTWVGRKQGAKRSWFGMLTESCSRLLFFLIVTLLCIPKLGLCCPHSPETFCNLFFTHKMKMQCRVTMLDTWVCNVLCYFNFSVLCLRQRWGHSQMLSGVVTAECTELCSCKSEHQARWSCRNTAGKEPVPGSLNLGFLLTGTLSISAIGVSTLREERVGCWTGSR